MTSRRLEPLEILDWYDGIVVAVVRTSWEPGRFLASLLAVTESQGERVFALLPVSEAQAETLRATADWEELQSKLRSIVGNLSGPVMLIRVDVGGDVVATGQARPEDVREDVMGGFDEALDRSRRRWLHAF